jgi:hypothetical protein
MFSNKSRIREQSLKVLKKRYKCNQNYNRNSQVVREVCKIAKSL